MSETYDNWEELEEHIIEQETTRKINELARIENEKHRINTLNKTIEDIVLTASDKVINDPRFTQIITEAIESEISQIGENTRNIAKNAEDIAVNTEAIAKNAEDIATNAEDIASANTALQMKYDLGLGTEIPAGADLDDYTTPGVYRTTGASITASLSNKPSGLKNTITLVVTKKFSSAVVQRISDNITGVTYTRYVNIGGQADDWILVEIGSPMTLGLGTEIPTGADLNNYTTPGVYRCVSADIGSSLLNCPINNAFVLIVDASIGGNYILQTIKHYSMTAHGQPLELRRNREWNLDWIDWRPTAGVDAIVAEGESGGWHWTKYANGTCEAFGRFSKTGATSTSAYVGGYYLDQHIDFPFTIYEANVNLASERFPFFSVYSSNKNDTGFDAMAVTSRSADSTTATVTATVKGRWK